MRRNMENIHGFAQANHKEILEMKAALSRLESQVEAVVALIHKSTFNNVMNYGCELSEFFPVERKDQIEIFMNRDHPEWGSRKSEFYHLLYTTATKDKNGFGRGLIKALFSRQYITKVKWPSTG